MVAGGVDLRPRELSEVRCHMCVVGYEFRNVNLLYVNCEIRIVGC